MRILTNILTVFLVLLFFISPCYSKEKHKLAAPTQGSISSPFGPRIDPFSRQWGYHSGIDIAANQNSPIYALQEGKVIYSGWDGGYGKCIVIDHNYPDIPKVPRVQTRYAHNSQNLVNKGDYVRRGQIIGYIGSTGRSTGPHLHFEVVYRGSAINPLDYLYKLPAYLDYVVYVRENQRYTSYAQGGN
ncbi:MAG: hypothetical protein A2Y25_11385 [Candidatus Melainabacteria bacterium GWF2_37_15]|nr:MAG: hypothetical protein A2Y25_11385 [Candidatus Melainabacteria bacterium GWF2_37_15]